MTAEPGFGSTVAEVDRPAPSTLRLAQRSGLWLLLCVAGTIGVAWVAIQLQTHGFAPLGLTALAIGVLVAALCRQAALATGAPTRRMGMIAAIGGALLVIVAQDYIGLWEHIRERERFAAANPKGAVFAEDSESLAPAAFVRYLRRHIASMPVAWGVDATLTVAAAIAWTMFASRRGLRGGVRNEVDAAPHRATEH